MQLSIRARIAASLLVMAYMPALALAQSSDAICTEQHFGYFELKGPNTTPPDVERVTIARLPDARLIQVQVLESRNNRNPNQNHTITFVRSAGGSGQVETDVFETKPNTSYAAEADTLELAVWKNDPGMRTIVRGCWRLLQ